MAVMHALADSGYVDILATISSNKSELTIPCIEIINTYFKRPDISLGVAKGESAVTLECPHNKKWTEVLPQKYTHRIAKSSDAPMLLRYIDLFYARNQIIVSQSAPSELSPT